MKYLYLLFWLIVILVITSFTLLNAHTVEFDYYFSSFKIFLPLLLLAVLIIGIILGNILMLPGLLRNKRRFHQARAQAKKLEKEVNNLRSIPIDNEH